MVVTLTGIWLLISSEQESVSFIFMIESFSLAAAFPVGAAIPILSCLPGFWPISSASIFTTVDVLPVPGPPEIIQKRLTIAAIAATACQSISPAGLSLKSSFSPEIS